MFLLQEKLSNPHILLFFDKKYANYLFKKRMFADINQVVFDSFAKKLKQGMRKLQMEELNRLSVEDFKETNKNIPYCIDIKNSQNWSN